MMVGAALIIRDATVVVGTERTRTKTAPNGGVGGLHREGHHQCARATLRRGTAADRDPAFASRTTNDGPAISRRRRPRRRRSRARTSYCARRRCSWRRAALFAAADADDDAADDEGATASSLRGGTTSSLVPSRGGTKIASSQRRVTVGIGGSGTTREYVSSSGGTKIASSQRRVTTVECAECVGRARAAARRRRARRTRRCGRHAPIARRRATVARHPDDEERCGARRR